MAKKLPAAAAGLVARFRRQRPLRAGSLIVTIFGDSLVPRGGAIALGSLIQLAQPFGINERLVRTAAVRLAKEDWLEGRRAGKLSEYHLSGRGRERFAEATMRIYSQPEDVWSGRWTLIVVPAMRAADRNSIRKELLWLGFGQISPNVFAHPEFDSRTLACRASDLLTKTIGFDAELGGADAQRQLVRLGWDLDDLALRYQRFVTRFGAIETSLRRLSNLEPLACFIVRTLLIHEYRRLHLRDPLLPVRLLRADWPGARASALCRDIYAQVLAPSEMHLDTATTLAGPLPTADRSILQRFGGVNPPANAPASRPRR